MTSNINPNNIDGAYPVAGQDNNSQGFRDNFTNTKTNFGYAAAEITDLQNKAVLKSALTGSTLNNNMLGSLLSNAQLQQMSNTVVPLGSLSGTVGINYASGSYQTVTTSAPISLDFSNFTAAGTQDQVLLQVTVSDIGHTMQLPSAVGYGASATSELGIQGLDTMTNTITFPATGTYVYSFITADGGTSIYINDLTQGRSNFSGNVSLGNVAITATTAANTTTSGALTVAGGVGIAGNLYVGGNIVGNVTIDNIESVAGNITAGNVLTGGIVSATSNVTGGNILTGGIISATGNATVGNLTVLGNVFDSAGALAISTTSNGNISLAPNGTGQVLITTSASVTGNITGGNISVSGSFTGNLNVQPPVRANITATGTYSLSNTNSINILVANNTGYTATLNMPTSPVNGQICNFAISGNTVTLVVGTGTVSPAFAGSATAGTGYRYVYYTTDNSWYRVG